MEKRPDDGRRGSAWFGVPAMLGVLVVFAIGSAVRGPGGLIAAAVGVLILLLIIGIAMTLANRQ